MNGQTLISKGTCRCLLLSNASYLNTLSCAFVLNATSKLNSTSGYIVRLNCSSSRSQVEVVFLTDDDPDLAMIRRKKMARLVKREKEMEATREQRAKVTAEREKLLQRFLAPDALKYLEGLKTREPTFGSQVEEVILYLIVYRGIRQTVSQVDVRFIERQVKGEGPKIKIQRDGETSDFGSYVREAIRKGSDE